MDRELQRKVNCILPYTNKGSGISKEIEKVWVMDYLIVPVVIIFLNGITENY